MVDSSSTPQGVGVRGSDSATTTARRHGADGGRLKPTSEQLILRDATPRDATAIAEIYNESIRAGGSCLEEALYSPEDIKNMMASFHERETILLLLSAEPLADGTIAAGEALGWGVIKRYSERLGYRFTCETAVYLRRGLVGMGLGTRIKRAQMERCRRYRYHHMVAKILSSNTASIEYNKRLGYDIVGVQKEVGYQNGCWQDVTIMQRVLDTPLPEDDRQGDS